MNPSHLRQIGQQYTKKFFDAKLFSEHVMWRGWPITKLPTDLWIYQEIIHQTKPDTIIECGSGRGGSALFFADMLTMVGREVFGSRPIRVITIDKDKRFDPTEWPIEHREVLHFFQGFSNDPTTLEQVKHLLAIETPGCRVMVVLDSRHTDEHVLQELRLWSPLVANGCYIVAEDTVVAEGLGIQDQLAPGPLGAVQEFLQSNQKFQRVSYWHKFGATTNHGGYLQRVA